METKKYRKQTRMLLIWDAIMSGNISEVITGSKYRETRSYFFVSDDDNISENLAVEASNGSDNDSLNFKSDVK